MQGRISKAGDADVRRALYEAASALLMRFKRKDKIKTWGLLIARRTGHRKATVAAARELAVIMHAWATRRRRRPTSPRTRCARTAGCWRSWHEPDDAACLREIAFELV